MLKIRFISDKMDKNCSLMLKKLLVSRFCEELSEPIKLSSFCSIITSHLKLLSGERSRNIPSHNSCYLARFRIIPIKPFHPNWEKTNDLMTNLHHQTPHSLTLPSHGGFNSPFSPGNPTDPDLLSPAHKCYSPLCSAGGSRLGLCGDGPGSSLPVDLLIS